MTPTNTSAQSATKSIDSTHTILLYCITMMLWRGIVVVATTIPFVSTNAFVIVGRGGLPAQTSRTNPHQLAASTPAAEDSASSASSSSSLLDTLADVGYQVTVQKPLGVVFGENRAPFRGLVVDDVEPGLNGGVAGIRVGDQLMSVNGMYLVNADFDTVMDQLRNSPSPLDLQLYRGSISSLFTIVVNKNGMVDVDGDDNDDDDDDDEQDGIVMDENYEPPIVTAEDYGDNTISVSKVAGEAFKSIGGMFSGGFKSIMTAPSKMNETIQLEGDDAKTGQKDL
jgi:PDZ domain